MEMRVVSGLQGRSFDSDIYSVTNSEYFVGEWVVANPKTSSSVATLQYDGPDQSFSLDINGLGNVDLTLGGLNQGFLLEIVNDLTTTCEIHVYSPNGNVCTLNFEVPAIPPTYNYLDALYTVEFYQFSGNCDFTNVGAIELILPSTDAIDFIVRYFSTFQFAASASPTPTPRPTTSNTPTPFKNYSATPSPSMRPSSTTNIMIDDFTVGSDIQHILEALPVSLTEDDKAILFNSTYSEFNCNNLIGCGRDLVIQVKDGQRGSVFSSSILDIGYGKGEWYISNPKGSYSIYTIQYDGPDNSTSLNTSGLGGIDLTNNGNYTDFTLYVESDISVTITIELFSTIGDICSGSIDINPTDPNSFLNEYSLPYSDFEGFCDIKDIGAIQILFPLPDEGNIIINNILSN